MTHITLPRAVVEQVLETLENYEIAKAETVAALRAALEASKEVEPVACPFCGSTSGFHRHTCINWKCDPETGEPLRDTHPAPAVPEGWQLVPKYPTREMIEEGNDGFRSPDSRRHSVSSCYKAMLAAAPQPD